MGIFKKTKDDMDDVFEVSEYAHEETSEPSAPASSAPSASISKKSGQRYGIEDAIALMRKLPNVNSDITITVVKKTLESANIQVTEIIDDAYRILLSFGSTVYRDSLESLLKHAIERKG